MNLHYNPYIKIKTGKVIVIISTCVPPAAGVATHRMNRSKLKKRKST